MHLLPQTKLFFQPKNNSSGYQIGVREIHVIHEKNYHLAISINQPHGLFDSLYFFVDVEYVDVLGTFSAPYLMTASFSAPSKLFEGPFLDFSIQVIPVDALGASQKISDRKRLSMAMVYWSLEGNPISDETRQS